MKPKKRKLKNYVAARVETRTYVYNIEAESEKEALQKLKCGQGKRRENEDFIVEVTFQIL